MLTDGLENSSRRYSQQMVAGRIEHQRSKYAWDFVFLGANQDAVLTARGLNIAMEAAMTYKAERGQMFAAMDAVSAYVGSYRRGTRSAFSSSDPANAMGQDEKPKPNADNPGGSKGKDGNGPLS